MGRSWIVDCNNVMGSRPDGWWRDRPAAARRLVDEIIPWRADNGEPVAVVVDGYPKDQLPEGSRSGVEIRYAHSGRRDAADDEIVGMVEAAKQPESLTVVTSDSELGERVEARGARTEGARRFLERISDRDQR